MRQEAIAWSGDYGRGVQWVCLTTDHCRSPRQRIKALHRLSQVKCSNKKPHVSCTKHGRKGRGSVKPSLSPYLTSWLGTGQPDKRDSQRVRDIHNSFGTRWRRMHSFGLKDTPCRSFKLMNQDLRGTEKYVVPYSDDVTIFLHSQQSIWTIFAIFSVG